MAESILKDPEHVLPYVDRVRLLADDHRLEFGFLADRVYAESAIRRNLWIAVNSASRDFLGYLLLGGQHPQMKIFHICIHDNYRLSGVGKTLISKLVENSIECG